MRLRVLDFGTDKYGLNAWIFDSTNDRRVNYDKVLFSRTKSASDSVGVIAEGQWADVKVKIADGPSAGLTAGMLVRVEELAPNLSRVRLFHTSVSRALATWPNWPGASGFTGDFAEYLAQKFRTSTAADFAVLEAGVVSEETYVDQGLYWSRAHLPMLEYVVKTYRPDLLLVGMPTTDEFQHQFLGLVSPRLPGGAPNPAYDDVFLDGTRDRRVQAREGFIRSAYREADETLTLARELMGGGAGRGGGGERKMGGADDLRLVRPRLRAAVSRDRRLEAARRPRPALTAADVELPPCDGGDDRQGEGVLGRRSAAGLPQRRRSRSRRWRPPADRRSRRRRDARLDRDGVRRPRRPERLDARRPARGLEADRPHLHQGGGPLHPQRTEHHDRHGSPDPHGRSRRVLASRPTSSTRRRPERWCPRPTSSGSTATCPTCRTCPPTSTCGRRSWPEASGSPRGRVTARSIDLAPTLAFLLGIAEPQHSQGRVLLDVVRGGNSYRAVSLVGLNDFHGQLDPTTLAYDGINQPVGGAAFLATLFDEELASLRPRSGLILAGGDNVGASPPNSGLLEDRPAIDVENAWGLDATSYGNHEFDYGVARLLEHQARAKFPFLATNIVETSSGRAPDWVKPSVVIRVNGIRVGVIGAGLKNTPELVSAGATAGLTFLDEAPRVEAESERLRRQGVRVQVVVIHQGTNTGLNPFGNTPGVPWEGPILGIADALQGTTIDAMIVGHTHRVSNLMRGDILIVEGINAGTSYSVVQLLVRGSDVAWAGGATRVAKNLGVAPRADVKAIVDAANAETAVLRNRVIGRQVNDILRAPTRLFESEMGNLVADAMRDKYPGIDAAYTNSGGLRADLVFTPPSAGEQPGEITWGEMFAVLPFGNRTVILTLTGADLRAAFVNGFTPFCQPGFPGGTGRFPQISGLKVEFSCSGTTPVVVGMWKAPNGVGGTLTPIGPTDSVRLVTNDFMYGGGDGYTVFANGTNVAQPGDGLLEIAVDYVAANSPVDPVVDGRIDGP